MAKIMTAEQFKFCPKGTVFGFGGQWHFGNMLILDSFTGPYEGGAWGFYAIDPMWVDDEDSFGTLELMLDTGASSPSETSSTKYMSYDGEEMDLFIVLEESDWLSIRALVEKPFKQFSQESTKEEWEMTK